MENTLIIGCGISGLYLAKKMQEKKQHESILLVEKSKGVGGRLATRRSENATFDHGAQFYHLPPSLQDLHQNWMKTKIVQPLLHPESRPKFCGTKGMTGIAKQLAQNLNLLLNTKITKLEKTPDAWIAHTDTGTQFSTKQVILSCPLPQSIELLQNSAIAFDSELLNIKYAKALVVLLEDIQTTLDPENKNAYQELNKFGIFSVCDQYKKGISRTPAWTITMNPEFSEQHFELEETEILKMALKQITEALPTLSFAKCSLKKWRYSRPLSTYSKPFYTPTSGIYLIGDAFGGPSINGAIRSAEALQKEL